MSTRGRDIAAAVDHVLDMWWTLTDAERSATHPLLAAALASLDRAVSSGPKRAECPVCGGQFTVTVHGRLRSHLGTERGDIWRKECAGSRRTVDGLS